MHVILSALEKHLKAEQIVHSGSDLSAYSGDWCRQFSKPPALVVKPKSTEEVALIVRLCAENKVAMIAAGGRTGLTGAVCPLADELVISLESLNQISEVNFQNLTVTVGAGVINQQLQDYLRPYALQWPIHLASKGACQIGGNIATNAGGIHVIRYGVTRRWVMGLEYVNAFGEVRASHLALEKDNSGYDVSRLLIGSEGTLGIVTKTTLRLARLPQKTCLFVFAVHSVSEALLLLTDVQQQTFGRVYAAEFFANGCVTQQTKKPLFTKANHFYFLLQLELAGDADSALMNWALDKIDKECITDVIYADKLDEMERLWRYREDITETMSHLGWVHKNDLTIPLVRMKTFCDEVTAVLQGIDKRFDVYLFGHVGDGNIHVNKIAPKTMSQDEFIEVTAKMDEAIFALVRSYGGSISSEHGIGLLKKPYLHYAKSAAELAEMKRVKTALDPNNLFNPGKLLS